MSAAEKCPQCTAQLYGETDGYGHPRLACYSCPYVEWIGQKPDPYPSYYEETKRKDGTYRVRLRHRPLPTPGRGMVLKSSDKYAASGRKGGLAKAKRAAALKRYYGDTREAS